MPGQPVAHPGRLEALAETGLLDSLPEESFDRYTRLARSLLGADVSLLSLVDRDRQYFKSESGLSGELLATRQNDISYSFCRFVVESGEAFVIEDASHDPRVRSNPAVTELGIGSYLGMPVSTSEGYILGSLCAVGMTSRNWSPTDLKNLADLAAAVTREIELAEQFSAVKHALGRTQKHQSDREKELRGIVHDLRTPAAAVSSCLLMFSRENQSLPPEGRELIDLSRESTGQMLEMIERILETDRIRSGGVVAQIRPVSVSSLLRRVGRTVRPFADEAGVRLEFPLVEHLVHLKADEKLIERVLLNLLTNAVKYSPTGSVVSVGVIPESERGEAFCRITVTDQGPGVPDDEKEAIFSEFTTGTNRGNHGLPSFGIGLSFCKSAVDLHQGKIGVDDAPGGGSRFYCRLPAVA